MWYSTRRLLSDTSATGPRRHDERPPARRVDGESRHKLTRAKVGFVLTLLRLPAAHHLEWDARRPLAAPDDQLQWPDVVGRRDQTKQTRLCRRRRDKRAFDLPRLVDLSADRVDHNDELLTDGREEHSRGRPGQSADVARHAEVDHAARAKRSQVNEVDLAFLAACKGESPSIGRESDQSPGSHIDARGPRRERARVEFGELCAVSIPHQPQQVAGRWMKCLFGRRFLSSAASPAGRENRDKREAGAERTNSHSRITPRPGAAFQSAVGQAAAESQRCQALS